MQRLQILPLALVLSASVLVGCSSRTEPSPDPTLVLLALSAQSDGRVEQSTELFDEIQRLCGHLPNDERPASCTEQTILESASLPQPQDLNAAAAQIRQLATAVPASSRGLIARQYQQLIQLGAANPPADLSLQVASSTNTQDINAIKEALNWEYSVIAGLSIASAYTSADLNSVMNIHRDIAQYLTHLLDSAGIEAPVASPGYTFNEVTPTDAASADAFLAEVTSQAPNLWLNAAENAQSSQWYSAILWALGTVS
ncbi:MAG: hypothetical protein Q3972_04135 [Corynebacterium sp.]|nr:hypothetical protein [Corynebacterium sp.]